MKRFLLVAVFLLLPGLLPGATAYGQDCSEAESLQRHIYKPERLVPVKGCITLTGQIIARVTEADGDLHYRLKLDEGQGDGLINAKNVTKTQKDFLILEPICIGKVTQASAMRACEGFRQQITLPRKGDRVSVTGIHVLDKEHGWLEIHPVTKITILDDGVTSTGRTRSKRQK